MAKWEVEDSDGHVRQIETKGEQPPTDEEIEGYPLSVIEQDVNRVERKIGRRLTQKEIDQLSAIPGDQPATDAEVERIVNSKAALNLSGDDLGLVPFGEDEVEGILLKMLDDRRAAKRKEKKNGK